MGRGRAKAKQTKVARQLKYQPAGDLDRLRSELGVDSQSRSNGSSDHDLDDRYSAYADYAEEDEDEEDDEDDEEDDSFPHR